MMDLTAQIHELGRRAKAAARELARLSSEQKNAGLLAMADALVASREELLAANRRDLERARTAGLSKAMLDRLTLTPERIAAMADDIRQVAALPDPVGEVLSQWTRPNGIEISKVRVPIGVIGIIYESRPNVTSDAAVLCTKTGNATLLRGGSESIESNRAIAAALSRGAAAAGLPADAILLVPTTDREAVTIMAKMDRFIDLIVPRGGQALIEAVVNAARMPVIKHYHGVCIAYVDREADLEMATRVVVNAKTQRPGVCNALETVLVDREVAGPFFAKAGEALREKGVQIRGDATVAELLGGDVEAATEADWSTEYLDLILAAKVVDGLDEAIDHIERYGSHHSDCIVTRSAERAERFLNEVDSATVYWNASTRFTDGAEFGFGAEIGISTDKLHARGPMALEELTTYKYLIRGNGQTRE
ncbi:MAG TPA: glutamate-5-semialdehyde dehydrogenase [Chthoniobacteraceae bacterium]|nr:glutamate-5-semialdehyde dehydrogenase [Chthoniobacteraceae bacterium]